MGQCVQLWTRNYGALDQTARVCFGVLCANRKKEEVKRDFGPANKKERGACCKKPGERDCEKCWMQVSPVPACEECPRSACLPFFSRRRIRKRFPVFPPAMLRERKDVLLEVAKELRVEIDITLPKIEFKKRIGQSKYYDEESVKYLLEGILEEEREKQEIKEYEERRLARERELERLRIQLRNKLNENKLKAGNRINDLANVCILSGNRTTEVSESVNKCRPVNNPAVSKSVENATSCDFEKKNCDPPVRCTNVSHPSEVGRKEFNVNRSSDCDVEMKVGVCEGRGQNCGDGCTAGNNS
ncbi:hypothetical protein TNCV_4848431 [Trichonephila clavipes]|nr:hypothetical protein TNCV_4848431 [Trichonephila clavipes]